MMWTKWGKKMNIKDIPRDQSSAQQAPTACQAEIDYKEIHTNFPEWKHAKVPNFFFFIRPKTLK